MVNGLKTKEAHDIIVDASITGRIDMSKIEKWYLLVQSSKNSKYTCYQETKAIFM